MLTTIEAEIDVNGNVTLLEPLKITKKSRALVTLLDENTANRKTSETNDKIAEERFARHFGAAKSGDERSADNEKIDDDLIRADGNTYENE